MTIGECVSATQVPLMECSHIAATFDPNGGLTIYINGQEAGHLKITGRFARRRAEAHRTENGCVEHMSDKQARYSHVRLIENSPARIVVHGAMP
jgi:hypothetical protein